MEKIIQKYTKLYRDGLKNLGYGQILEKAQAYKIRLRQMYDSPQFRNHNIYPSMNVENVYAVIAMCLELRGFGLSDDEIIAFTNVAFRRRKRLFAAIIRAIDLLPNSFQIAKQWNISDHAKREQDHSITYDTFTADNSRIAYRISKCMYVEMFAYYGIRELCKIFCITDTQAYSNLTRHVEFVRYSDLSDGESCTDEIYKKS